MMTTFSSMHPDTRPPLGVLKMLVVQSDPHGCPHGEHATCASKLLFFSSFTESFPMGPYMDRVKDGV